MSCVDRTAWEKNEMTIYQFMCISWVVSAVASSRDKVGPLILRPICRYAFGDKFRRRKYFTENIACLAWRFWSDAQTSQVYPPFERITFHLSPQSPPQFQCPRPTWLGLKSNYCRMNSRSRPCLRI